MPIPVKNNHEAIYEICMQSLGWHAMLSASCPLSSGQGITTAKVNGRKVTFYKQTGTWIYEDAKVYKSIKVLISKLTND